MQSVLTTSTFETQAKRVGLTDDELDAIIWAIAADPESGAVIRGTGGARKLRFAGRGHGKSGGYRTIHYFGGTDVPVFLLGIYGKGSKANLTDAERNDLARILPELADVYRAKKQRS